MSFKTCSSMANQCSESAAPAIIQTASTGSTTWSSDFSAQWQSQWNSGDPWDGAAGSQLYGNSWAPADPGNLATIENGQLVLRAQPCQNPAGKPMCGAELTTRGKYDFTHGYIEARIAVDNSPGLWPGFWLMGNGQWPATGEIDIMEIVNNGNDNGKPFFTSHWAGCGGQCQQAAPVSAGSTDGAFHTYGLRRTSSELIQYVDGREAGRLTRSSLQDQGGDPSPLFDAPMHVRLDLGSGGEWAGNNQQPGVMRVDYVKETQ